MSDEDSTIKTLLHYIEKGANNYTSLQGKLKGHFELQNRDIVDILQILNDTKKVNDFITETIRGIIEDKSLDEMKVLLTDNREGHIRWYLHKIKNILEVKMEEERLRLKEEQIEAEEKLKLDKEQWWKFITVISSLGVLLISITASVVWYLTKNGILK